MKKTLKSIFLILLAATLSLTFTACEEKDKPLAVVEKYFKELAAGNFETADSMTTESIFSENFFSNDRNMARLLIDEPQNKINIVKGISIISISSSKKIAGNYEVKANIRSYNLVEILADYLMLSFADAEKEGPELFNTLLENINAEYKYKDTQIKITLRESGGKYKIVANDKLADAISGGLATSENYEPKSTAEK